MNNEQQLMSTIAQMKAAGMTDGMIENFLGRLGDAAMQEAQSMRPSQRDGVTVVQSEPDAPGVYIDASQVAQDQYANALARGADITPPVSGSMVGGPPRATDLSINAMAAGNPNYTVAEPTRTTVNSQGQIVTY